MPAELSKRALLLLLVALCISTQFSLPELSSRRRDSSLFTTGMEMPEAGVHEDHGLVLRQNNVRASGQIFPMQAETVAHAVQHRANHLFRRGVLAPDTAHVPGAVFGCELVGRGLGESMFLL